MKKIEEVSLGFLGARFESIKIYLFSYNGNNKDDILEWNRLTKDSLCESDCGLTSYVNWVYNYSEPRIMIFINLDKPGSDEKLIERLIKDTIPHEISHAIGKIAKRYSLEPGCEVLARMQGYTTWKFQMALEKELGYELVKKR